jgi:hypothetical protein
VVALGHAHITPDLVLRNRHAPLCKYTLQSADRRETAMIDGRAGPIENHCRDFVGLSHYFIIALSKSHGPKTDDD